MNETTAWYLGIRGEKRAAAKWQKVLGALGDAPDRAKMLLKMRRGTPGAVPGSSPLQLRSSMQADLPTSDLKNRLAKHHVSRGKYEDQAILRGQPNVANITRWDPLSQEVKPTITWGHEADMFGGQPAKLLRHEIEEGRGAMKLFPKGKMTREQAVQGATQHGSGMVGGGGHESASPLIAERLGSGAQWPRMAYQSAELRGARRIQHGDFSRIPDSILEQHAPADLKEYARLGGDQVQKMRGASRIDQRLLRQYGNVGGHSMPVRGRGADKLTRAMRQKEQVLR
jgi:hypothetical protein